MSDLAIAPAGQKAESGFRARTVTLMLVIGILGFIGSLVLGAYAPDLRSGRNGGGHALSNAAIGFSGLVRLAEATGRNPTIIRNKRQLGARDLMVLTPERGITDMTEALAGRDAEPTLVILPKWNTEADPGRRGWVRYTGLKYPFDPEGVLAPSTKLHVARHRSGGRPLIINDITMKGIAFTAPRPLQVITGSDSYQVKQNGKTVQRGQLTAVISDDQGGIVLAQIDGRPLWVLADPDLLTNQGLADPRNARSALLLLDWLNVNGPKTINFDVTLNGFGASSNPLKLAFEPPFLAGTLAIAIALALAGWQALARFGAPRRRERAIAFGKTALVDNAAALIRKSGRQASLGGRYVDVIRDRAVTVFGVPSRLREGAIDAYLDRLGGSRRFSDLAATVRAARGRHELTDAAGALHQWLWEKRR